MSDLYRFAVVLSVLLMVFSITLDACDDGEINSREVDTEFRLQDPNLDWEFQVVSPDTIDRVILLNADGTIDISGYDTTDEATKAFIESLSFNWEQCSCMCSEVDTPQG